MEHHITILGLTLAGSSVPMSISRTLVVPVVLVEKHWLRYISCKAISTLHERYAQFPDFSHKHTVQPYVEIRLLSTLQLTMEMV